MFEGLFNRIKAAVPKIINAISNKVNEIVNDVCERNERILEKVKESWKQMSSELDRGTVTIGAVGPPAKNTFLILDFLFQVKDAVVEEYPILAWPNNKLKEGIESVKGGLATGEKFVGGFIYDQDIPIISDFVGAFTGVREPGAESNLASMYGAYGRGFLVKGVGGTVEGLATLAADPLEAAEGINKIFAYPEEMLPAIGNGISDYWDTKIVNGSPEDRAEVSGQVLFEIASMFIGTGEAKAAAKAASTGADVAQVADKVSDVSKVADKAVDLAKYQASLKALGKQLAMDIDQGILTKGRALCDGIDNLISAMNKHKSTLQPAYAGLDNLDDVGKTADKFEDWYSSVKKSMMKTDSTGGSGVKVSGPVDELNPKALNEVGEKIAKEAGKSDLLDDAGKFIDNALESDYQKYVKRKLKGGKTPRDRNNWKEIRDYWLNDSPMARGNKFNNTAVEEKWYPYNEIHLENGKRLDSYDPFMKEIISRKATELSDIDISTFEKYLKELGEKYASGTKIRSNKYSVIDGQVLEGKFVLEIPESNRAFSEIDDYIKLAKEKYNVEIRFRRE